MQLTNRGPKAGAINLAMKNVKYAQAQVSVLSEIAGYAELLLPPDYPDDFEQ